MTKRPVVKIFGKRIAEERNARYLRQKDLAAAVEMTYKNVERIESLNEAGVDRWRIPLFAKFLGMPVDQFVKEFVVPEPDGSSDDPVEAFITSLAQPGRRSEVTIAATIALAALDEKTRASVLGLALGVRQNINSFTAAVGEASKLLNKQKK